MRARVALLLGLVFLFSVPPVAGQTSPRELGNALRARLGAEGTLAELEGKQRLRVHLGASPRVHGSLVLETERVEREGQAIYRIDDRLDVDLPGMGSARLRVRGHLLADLSVQELLLESEEIRGNNTIAVERVGLRHDGEGWLRHVETGRGQAEPERVDLPADILVLTPPLGVGERLARLAEPELGRRLSVRAYDLETGLNTTWKLSVEERVTLKLGEQQVLGVRVLRREGPAALELLRELARGALPRQLRADPPGRFLYRDPRLARSVPAGEGAVACVLRLLRACATTDRPGLKACLDVEALYAASVPRGPDALPLGVFLDVLIKELTRVDWLRDLGLSLPAEACLPEHFAATPEGAQVRVHVRESPEVSTGFLLGQGSEGTWRVVDLPRRR